MTTQTATTELTLEQLDDVNGGAWYNPYDWWREIVDSVYDTYDEHLNDKAKKNHAGKTGLTDGSV